MKVGKKDVFSREDKSALYGKTQTKGALFRRECKTYCI